MWQLFALSGKLRFWFKCLFVCFYTSHSIPTLLEMKYLLLRTFLYCCSVITSYRHDWPQQVGGIVGVADRQHPKEKASQVMVMITSLSLIPIPFSPGRKANCQDYQDKMVLMQGQVGAGTRLSVFLGYWIHLSGQLLKLMLNDYCKTDFTLDKWLHMSQISSEMHSSLQNLSAIICIHTDVFYVQNKSEKWRKWRLGSYIG